MKTPSPVLEALARRYERSQAGRTGTANRDLLVLLEELLAEAGCNEGENRALAEQQLADAESAGLLVRVPVHKRDRSHIHQIRFPAINEDALYTKIARLSPTKTREKLADQFTAAATTDVPTRWREKWAAWCGRMRNEALAGRSIAGFDREPSRANDELWPCFRNCWHGMVNRSFDFQVACCAVHPNSWKNLPCWNEMANFQANCVAN